MRYAHSDVPCRRRRGHRCPRTPAPPRLSSASYLAAGDTFGNSGLFCLIIQPRETRHSANMAPQFTSQFTLPPAEIRAIVHRTYVRKIGATTAFYADPLIRRGFSPRSNRPVLEEAATTRQSPETSPVGNGLLAICHVVEALVSRQARWRPGRAPHVWWCWRLPGCADRSQWAHDPGLSKERT